MVLVKSIGYGSIELLGYRRKVLDFQEKLKSCNRPGMIATNQLKLLLGALKKMPSRKRLKSVCHGIAHHAVSNLSYLHPNLRQACREIGVHCVRFDLKLEDPCPDIFMQNKLLHRSLLALHHKFKDILIAEGFTLGDIESVSLTFYSTAEFPADRFSLCEAKIVSLAGKEYRYIVDYFGKIQSWNNSPPEDCPLPSSSGNLRIMKIITKASVIAGITVTLIYFITFAVVYMNMGAFLFLVIILMLRARKHHITKLYNWIAKLLELFSSKNWTK